MSLDYQKGPIHCRSWSLPRAIANAGCVGLSPLHCVLAMFSLALPQLLGKVGEVIRKTKSELQSYHWTTAPQDTGNQVPMLAVCDMLGFSVLGCCRNVQPSTLMSPH